MFCNCGYIKFNLRSVSLGMASAGQTAIFRGNQGSRLGQIIRHEFCARVVHGAKQYIQSKSSHTVFLL